MSDNGLAETTLLDFAQAGAHNAGMELLGYVRNGVVVLDGNPVLPEGVRIVHEPGKLPYVTGGVPGTWPLTNEVIAQILDEEDIESMKGMFDVPS